MIDELDQMKQIDDLGLKCDSIFKNTTQLFSQKVVELSLIDKKTIELKVRILFVLVLYFQYMISFSLV